MQVSFAKLDFEFYRGRNRIIFCIFITRSEFVLYLRIRYEIFDHTKSVDQSSKLDEQSLKKKFYLPPKKTPTARVTLQRRAETARVVEKKRRRPN